MTVAQQYRREPRALPEPTRANARILRSFHHVLSAPAGAAAPEEPGLQSEIDEYLGDMVAAYGGVYHGAMSEEPSRTAYNRLVHRLLTEALSCVGRIDRVILAYALPDSQPGYWCVRR